MSGKVIQRIDEYRKYKGLSLHKLDIQLGRSNGYFGKQIKANASIGSDILEKFFSTFKDCNPNWLLTGYGNMLKEDEPKPKSIDDLIEEKIENKLNDMGYTIDDLNTLYRILEFSREQREIDLKQLSKKKE